ncbi:MAG: TonB-dependent receptor family protein, partial [Prevotella sp.]|nr:TonB-dependent receptor family protein [Prevotella sp.]
SVFISYQLTPTQQLQLNYTRRLRRPWGGQLNNFKNTRDASMVEYGNPYLTPEYSNAFALNYLKQWTEHTLSLSAYYRPTTDVMQRIRYLNSVDSKMHQTTMNVTKNLSTGIEMVLKNKLFKIVDLTTTFNAYYYKIDGFSFDIDGQTVTGDEDHNFSWTGRMMASVRLPYNLSVQLSGNYRSRQVVTQGYRKPMYGMDLGIRKTFFDKQLAISVNVRDLLDSRHFEVFTSSDTFTRHQRNWRGGRRANISITWNFGNMKKKSKTEGAEGNEQEDDQHNNNFQQDNNFQQNNNFGGGEE